MKREILLLGDPRLYETAEPVARGELPGLRAVVSDLRDTLLDYRARCGAGRAIAAPQIGVPKRILYLEIDRPVIFLNPELSFPDGETMEVMDDCMSFPHLLVRVRRFRRCIVRYRDIEWRAQELHLEGALSELLQHEYDHLDGVLATMRAVDACSFYEKTDIR